MSKSIAVAIGGCPSWPGGAAEHIKKYREATAECEAGWWFKFDRENFLNHHPVCGAEVAPRHFLTAAADPPGQEGRGA